MRKFAAGFVLMALTILAIPAILVCAPFGLHDGFLVYGRWMMRVGRSVLGIRVEATSLERLERLLPQIRLPSRICLAFSPGGLDFSILLGPI